MKIMHLCTGFPISYNGGITNYVRNLAISQIENGNEVVVVGRKCTEKSTFCFKYIEYNDLFIRPFTLKFKKSPTSLSKIKKIIKIEKPDLIHIHMILDVDCELYKVLKKLNIKYVISLHDYSFLCPRILMYKDGKNCNGINEEKCSKCATALEQTAYLSKILKKINIDISNIGNKKSFNFIKMFECYKKLLENAELLLPVSNRVKEIYLNAGINNKYEVLHIGNISADCFKKYQIKKFNKDDKIKILFLGRFSTEKGKDEYIKLANRLNKDKYEFYFLGRTSNENQECMKQNDIQNMGGYKQDELSDKLKKYDIGCVLSIWEDNAPQVVMELLNNNIPVIGTKMGGIPDFIEDNKNGFIYNPYSEESFNNLIKRLNKLNKQEIELIKNNIERTKTTYEHFYELNQIYEGIITNNVVTK